ncbi:hypothetical protein [Natronoglycomyces albus]|uniref:Uncharacterized protein n=1 Tax=Natronoglycomyces albus TaxID=2811108 RepID=A0A895XHS2_9ACTN|nr:hypothetical protein [Natronoglycomyces albus]QSB05381.1 hypothetical protein JQS30_00070 [Natronoglycomyces albus]
MIGRHWFSRFESFYVQGVKSGALIRHWSPSGLRSLIAFSPAPGTLVANEQETWYESDILAWTKFRYRTHGDNSEIEVRRDPLLHQNCVPGYTEILLVERLLASGEDCAEFSVLFESELGHPLHSATLTKTGRAAAARPSKHLDPKDITIELAVDGTTTNRHHARSGVVISSDWGGARSYLAPDFDSACSGLPTQVRQVLQEFTP